MAKHFDDIVSLLALVTHAALMGNSEPTTARLRRLDIHQTDVLIVIPVLRRHASKDTHELVLQAEADSPEQMIISALRRAPELASRPRAILVKNGRARRAEQFLGGENKAAEIYHDCESEAVLSAIEVQTEEGVKGHCLEGGFVLEGMRYSIQPWQVRRCASGIVSSLRHQLRQVSVANTTASQKTCPTRESADIASSINRRPPDRLRRQFQNDYAVDMTYIVDYSVYDWFYTEAMDPAIFVSEELSHLEAIARIVYYFTNVAAGVALRFSSFDRTTKAMRWTLRTKLIDVYIIQNKGDSNVTENARVTVPTIKDLIIDGDQALPNLYKYINTSGDWLLDSGSDHVALFTKYKIYLGSSNYTQPALGMTHINGICDYKKAALVRFIGAFFESFSHAHELGHNLGARHDGDGNRCLPKDQYIMTSQPESDNSNNYINNFLFSQCSQDYFIARLLSKTHTNCLFDTDAYGPPVFTRIVVTDRTPPGQKYPADEQCQMGQMVLGSKENTWSTCGGSRNMRQICQVLKCHDGKPNSTYCQAAFQGTRAAEGTSCGNHKWCVRGTCTYNESAPEGSDDCPYGDFKGLLRTRRVTCASAQPRLCYYSDVSDACCATCPLYANVSFVGCEYGDRDPAVCASMAAQQCANVTYRSSCCNYCQDRRTMDTGCPWGESQSDCASLVSNGICYTEPDSCCVSCRQRFNASDATCPYGDHSDSYCAGMTRETCYGETRCCRTCAQFLTTTAAPKTTAAPETTASSTQVTIGFSNADDGFTVDGTTVGTASIMPVSLAPARKCFTPPLVLIFLVAAERSLLDAYLVQRG